MDRRLVTDGLTPIRPSSKYNLIFWQVFRFNLVLIATIIYQIQEQNQRLNSKTSFQI